MNTPKSLLFNFFLLIFCLQINAQKIKVKKDQVLLDKSPIAVFEDLGSTYNYANVGDKENPIFTVDYNFLKISESVTKRWLVISDINKTKSTQVELEYLSFTLNNKKAISELLFKKYKILTSSGIDETALIDFLSVERPNLREEYNALLKSEVEKENIVANVDVSVDTRQKKIFKGNDSSTNKESNDNLIGSYTYSISDSRVSIYDLDKNSIAIATSSVFDEVTVILPQTNEEFTYKALKKFGINFENNPKYQSGFVRELVGHLYLKGITLGHQLRDQKSARIAAKKAIAKQKYEEALENSSNIYFTKGHVIDEKAGKIEGHVQFIVENVISPEDFKNVVDLDETNLGKRVVLKYTNAKGKERLKTYKSKDGEAFCVNLNNEEVCFRGVKVKGKALQDIANSSALSLSFDNSSYYVIVEETPTLSIYKEYATERDEFIIKVSSQDKGYKFNTKNREKNIEKLTDYLGESIDKSDLEALNYANPEDVKKLLELYKK